MHHFPSKLRDFCSVKEATFILYKPYLKDKSSKTATTTLIGAYGVIFSTCM